MRELQIGHIVNNFIRLLYNPSTTLLNPSINRNALITRITIITNSSGELTRGYLLEIMQEVCKFVGS